MALPGFGTMTLLGGGSLAVVGSIFALWTHYNHTLQTISDTGGEVVPEPLPTQAIPDAYQGKADEIIQGYEDAYFGPIRQAGEQVNDPTAPDPVVRVPDPPRQSPGATSSGSAP